VTRPILGVLDGAKGLGGALTDVLDHPVIASCQQHKLRNVGDKLPERLGGLVEHRLPPPTTPSALDAEAQLQALAVSWTRPPRGRRQPARGLAET
jgi:hypothetical protein